MLSRSPSDAGIGIRMAIGARQRDNILTQFLLEAIIISIAGCPDRGCCSASVEPSSSMQRQDRRRDLRQFGAGRPALLPASASSVSLLACKAAAPDPIEALRYQ